MQKDTSLSLGDSIEYTTPTPFWGVETLAPILLQKCIGVNTKIPHFCLFYAIYIKKA